MFFRLAFRNVLRNKRRTILGSLGIGVGLCSLILTDGYVQGTKVNMISNVVSTFMGDGQIHGRGFQKTKEVEKTVAGLEEIIKQLNNEPDLSSFSTRTVSFAMISSSSNYVNLGLIGVDFDREIKITKILRALKKGQLPKKDNEIYIGEKLANKLEVDIGDKLVVTVGQAYNGELSQEQFRVSGIFTFGSNEMDGAVVFIKKVVAQKMLNLNNEVHEIVLKFKDFKVAEDINNLIWKRYTTEKNIAENWKQLAPEVSSMLEMARYSTIIIGFIIFILVILGIINTLFMSLYERMYEFGVLRSIGTRPFSLFKLIILESISLWIISVVFGLILTFIFAFPMAKYGIDYDGMQVGEITISDPIYYIFSLSHITVIPLVVGLMCVISAIYPAIYASKITLTKAMQKSL